MEVIITLMIAVPLLYLSGGVYYHLGEWLGRAIGLLPPKPPEGQRAALQPDQRYAYALKAAFEIVGEFEQYPQMEKHHRLALVVYTILVAIDESEKER